METVDASAAALVEPPAPPVAVAVPQLRWSQDERRANAAWAGLITLTLLAVFLVLRFLPAVGWPLVLASIGAYLFDPVVTWLSSRRLGRTGATALLFAAGLLAGAALLLLVVPLVVRQVGRLPAYVSRMFATLVPHLEQALGRPLPSDVRELAAFAGTNLEQIVTKLLPGAGSIVGVVLGKSLSALSFVLGALVIPVVGFYLLRGWPNVKRGVDELIPPKQRPQFRERMAEVDRMLGGFIRGQLTMAAVLSMLYSGALSLIGLKLAVVVGLVTGFGNLVPYVGTATGVTLASAFCLIDFGVDYHLALVLGTFVVLVATDSMFITPRVVGNRVGLSPAAVIVAVLACGSLFGFAGVLLAVPSAAILKVVAKVSVDVYRQGRVYQEG